MEPRFVDVNDLERYAVFREDGHRYIPWTVIAEVRTAVPIRKRGRWVKSDVPLEGIRCSACGGGAWYYDSSKTVSGSRYCPNCGAEMDGGIPYE